MGQQKEEVDIHELIKKENGTIEDKRIVNKKFRNSIVEPVRRTKKFENKLSEFCEKFLEIISKFVATLGILTLGATLRGEWVIVLATAVKQWTGSYNEANELNNRTLREILSPENLKMEGWLWFWIFATVFSYVVYFSAGGILHWYFYVKRRHLAKEWKIQPNKWLPPELEFDEIMLGSLVAIITSTLAATLACYIYNGNPSAIYYKFDEYGWAWFFLQIPAIFIYQDYAIYVLHRMYHTPFMYKHFHKLHHKYKQPTAFSVAALHPVEIVHIQLTLYLPLFTIIPVHWLAFYICVIYLSYHGVLAHSGINFKAHWWQPWQPDAEFHDKHHELFHVNFGVNMLLWDQIHGTMMKKNQIYTEETFHNQPLMTNSQNHVD